MKALAHDEAQRVKKEIKTIKEAKEGTTIPDALLPVATNLSKIAADIRAQEPEYDSNDSEIDANDLDAGDIDALDTLGEFCLVALSFKPESESEPEPNLNSRRDVLSG